MAPPVPPAPQPFPEYPGYPATAPVPQPSGGAGFGKILGVVVLLAVLAGGGYFGYKKFIAKPAPAETAAAQPPAQPPVTTAVETPMASQPARAAQEQPSPAPPVAVPAVRMPDQPARSTASAAPAQRPPARTTPSSAGGTAAQAPAGTPSAPPSAAGQQPIYATPAGGIPPANPPPQPPATERSRILRPEREITPPPAVQPPSRAPAPPAGPSSGVLVWSGDLRKGDIITIDGSHASTGSLQGALPGVPVILETDYRGIGFSEMPGPSNGWKRVSFRALRDQKVVVTLRWKTFD